MRCNMKKGMLIIALMLLLVGCDINYNISINEDFSIVSEFNYTSDDLSTSSVIDDEDISFYEKSGYTVVELLRGVKIYKEYKDINAYLGVSNEAIDKVSYDRDSNTLNIVVNKDKCARLFTKGSTEDGDNLASSVSFTILSNIPVVSSNADLVNGKMYTWNFNKDSCDRNITISFDRSLAGSSGNNNSSNNDKTSDVNKDNTSNGNSIYLYVFLGVVLLFGLYVWYKRNRVNNEV